MRLGARVARATCAPAAGRSGPAASSPAGSRRAARHRARAARRRRLRPTPAAKPLWRRLTAISSAIAGSSSTIRMRGRFFMAMRQRTIDSISSIERVPHVRALDHVDDEFGDVLGVVADALDRLGQEQQVEAGGDGARVFHHVGDELAHEAVELLVDGSSSFRMATRGIDVQPGEARPAPCAAGRTPGRPATRSSDAGRRARRAAADDAT